MVLTGQNMIMILGNIIDNTIIMKKEHLIFLCFSIIVFQSCDNFGDTFYLIELNNKSNHNIRFAVGTAGTQYVYPDTLITQNKSDMGLAPLSSGTNTFIGKGTPWEDRFKELPKDTLSFYIFNQDTLNTYLWETIRNEYKIMVRYDLSIQDLELLDYKIIYPPSEQMKNVRMYPPYEGN